jgi:protein-disulfide isomerase
MPAARQPDPRARARLYQLGALVVTAAAVAAVLVAILTSGSTSQLAPGKPVPGARQALALLAGIPQHGVSLGDPRAPVTLVEFGDLQCPACAQFAEQALPEIVRRYVRGGRVLLQFRALDLIGADSRRAAAMAAALAAQDRLWQFIELAYRNQGLENSGYVTDTYLSALAAAIPGVELHRALAARSAPAALSELEQARALARAAHVSSTPSFTLARAGQPPRRFSPAGLDSGSFRAALEQLLSGRAARS